MNIDQTSAPNAEGRRESVSHSNVSNPAPRRTRFASPAPLAEQLPGVHHIELNLIYLYEWWPLRRRGQILDKLSRMAVEVRKRG